MLHTRIDQAGRHDELTRFVQRGDMSGLDDSVPVA
jgi:hypothetical protein